MKDINSVRITGVIFWQKLDDRQSYSILSVGIKLNDGTSMFCKISNPDTKTYDLIKPGNKIIISGGYLDTWEKQDGTSETMVKCNSSGCLFLPKEKAIPDINSIVILGKVTDYKENIATIEMIGERNPKTDKPTIRKVKINIGDSFNEIIGSKIMLEAKFGSVTKDGKSVMNINADYSKISLL